MVAGTHCSNAANPNIFGCQPAERSRGCDLRDRAKKCRQVPDGGTGAIYLLAVGASCLGATVVRSRLKS